MLIQVHTILDSSHVNSNLIPIFSKSVCHELIRNQTNFKSFLYSANAPKLICHV